MLKKRYRSAKQVDGIIDLERLRSGPPKCLERNPDLFFDLTFLSEDLRGMLGALSRRFSEDRIEGNGLFLAEAVKGLGKSHALLTAYHLFANPNPAKRWMQTQGYTWTPPQDPVIIIKKFTDEYLPFDALWSAISQEFHAEWNPKHPPSLDELRAALASKKLILIFDELERGITNIADLARRSQNLSFLQMLSEEANRSNQVTIFAAIYDGSVEPGSTLKRVARVELRFRKPEDRANIVRHRLFTNAESYDPSAADALIRSYINTWDRLGVKTSDDYLSRLKNAFPFLPGLMELIFDRISGSGGFQGTRGALGLLAAMLDASTSGSYLITAGHCNLSDRACADRLQDLDPAGNLINCAQGNLQDLRKQPLAESLASAVLLASLTPGVKGLTREELVRQVMAPGYDPNQFEGTFQAFRTYGSYFHEREGRFFFDLEENENAKVEIEALRLNDERAREEVKTIWKQDLFREVQQVVFFTEPEATKTALDHLTKNPLRFVLSPRRLSSVERHAIYFGSELRNQIVLLEPREDTAHLLNNRDILTAAKRAIAASNLAPTASTSERRNRYENISTQERRNVRDFIKTAGLVYVRVEAWGDRHEDSVFELESLGQAWDKQAILEHLRKQIYPRTLLGEHLKERLQSFHGMTISQVDRIYRNTLGYPVPLAVPDVSDAIVVLVEDRNCILGLQHQRRNFCGERVDLGAGELPLAVLAAPWPAAPPVPAHEPPTPTQPGPPAKTASPIPVPESPGRSPSFDERVTPSCRSKGELRQALAGKLSDVEGQAIQSARFQIFARYEKASLADYPSALRGGLTDSGDLEVQIDLTIPGPMDKARVETLCESLPTLASGTYSSRVRIIIRTHPESDSAGDGGQG
jgi:hypothetical protein